MNAYGDGIGELGELLLLRYKYDSLPMFGMRAVCCVDEHLLFLILGFMCNQGRLILL